MTNRGALFRNLILGGQDGLVNVLGIILGVATATNSNQIVIIAGIAATVAESISMAAVAYTSINAESEHYHSEVARVKNEIENDPQIKKDEMKSVYSDMGFSGDLLEKIVESVASKKKLWLNLLIHEKLKLDDPSEDMDPLFQGLIVGGSAVIGSIIPLIPFFFFSINEAIFYSLLFSLLSLFIFGAYKSQLTSGKWLRGGMELMLIGGGAALSGYLVGLLLGVKV